MARRNRLPQGTAAFVAKSHAILRAALASASSIREFLSEARALTPEERDTIVSQAIVLIEGFYVHLPQKRAMYAVDPVQALKLLAVRQLGLDDIAFHRELVRIFNSVRDLHTNYMLPAPFASSTAFLPFVIAEYFDHGHPRYMFHHWIDGFSHQTLVRGVEIVSWNGVPIERAVAAVADQNAGSNPEARHSRGVNGLTIRPLLRALPPDEEWVIVGYETEAGELLEHRANWLVFSPKADKGTAANSAGLGVDIETDAVRHAKKYLFVPWLVEKEAKARRRKVPHKGLETYQSVIPTIFSAGTKKTSRGEVAYVGIRTFNVDDADAFVAEFERLVEQLPQDGLILDVRDNGGGLIFAGEQLLQTLTPKRIEPERLQFVATKLTARLAKLNSPSSVYPADIDLSAWNDSLSRAPETGAVYSASFPITDPDACNRIGQIYQGPVVLLINALCYSTTDFFVAGFRDHNIGRIVGVDGNTGAGGANVWEHGLLDTLFSKRSASGLKRVADSPFVSLPAGAGMRVAIRRSLRVGPNIGTELEDLGVKLEPTDIYQLTRDDLLNDHRGLYEFATKEFAPEKAARLAASASPRDGGSMAVTVKTKNVNRVDVFVDDRPMASRDVPVDGNGEGSTSVTVPAPLLPDGQVRIEGYAKRKLVVAKRLGFRRGPRGGLEGPGTARAGKAKAWKIAALSDAGPILSADATQFPYSAIVCLAITGPSTSGGPERGTGWLIGPQTVITAGHCIYGPSSIGGGASSIDVVFGVGSAQAPVRFTLDQSQFEAHPQWQSAADDAFDFGCLFLPAPAPGLASFFSLASPPQDGQAAEIAGYPRQSGAQQVHRATDIVTCRDSRLYWEGQLGPGASGAPIWIGPSTRPQAVGVFTLSANATPPDIRARRPISVSSATLIRDELVEFIRQTEQRHGVAASLGAGALAASAGGVMAARSGSLSRGGTKPGHPAHRAQKSGWSRGNPR